MRVRLGVLASFACVLALLGCGGADNDGAAGGAAADVVPADVALYVSVDTDFDGEEWQQAEDLLGKFPGGDRAIEEFLNKLGADQGLDFEEDVKPALGPEVAFVAPDVVSEQPSFVGLTQPRDREKFEKLVAASDEPLVSEDVDGWTVFAEKQATIDEFKEARGGEPLAASDDFAAAMDGLEDGIAGLYVSAAALQEAAERNPSLQAAALQALTPEGELPMVGLTVGAEEDGARLEGNLVFESDLEQVGFPSAYEAELPAEVPAGVIAYFSFNDFERGFSHVRDALAQAEPGAELWLSEELAPLFAGEGALYVRGGGLIPEVTLVTQVEDEEAAVRKLDDVVKRIRASDPRFPAPERTEIAGVPARRVALEEPVALFYAAFDGTLVVTTAREGIADLREEDDHFADQEAFADAKEQAGMPAETTGFAYIELAEIVPLLTAYLGVSGGQVPPEAAEGLEPLQSLLAYSTAEDTTVRFSAFLGVE
jgi:Protein of unknown function (DUF3352)